jgi:hypothetical protein
MLKTARTHAEEWTKWKGHEETLQHKIAQSHVKKWPLNERKTQ